MTATLEKPNLQAVPDAQQPAVLTAVWEVMRQVRAVGKDGQMSGGGQSYSFRRWDDLSDALGDAFREHGVFLQTKTVQREYRVDEITETKYPKEGKSYTKTTRWTTCTIEMRYVLTSLVDGSTLVVEGYGEGRDSADKATSKAETMAIKYALSEAFMIATKDIADGDADSPEISHDPAAALQAFQEAKKAVIVAGKAAGMNPADLDADFKQRYGKTVSEAKLVDLQKYLGVLEFLAGEKSTEDQAAQLAAIENGGK